MFHQLSLISIINTDNFEEIVSASSFLSELKRIGLIFQETMQFFHVYLLI